MNQLDPLHFRRVGCDLDEMGKQTGFLDALVYPGQSFRNFRMVAAGFVQLIPFVV